MVYLTTEIWSSENLSPSVTSQQDAIQQAPSMTSQQDASQQVLSIASPHHSRDRSLPGPSESSRTLPAVRQEVSPNVHTLSYNDRLFLFWRDEHEYLLQKVKKLEDQLAKQGLNRFHPQEVPEAGSAFMIQRWQASSSVVKFKCSSESQRGRMLPLPRS